MSNSLVFKTRTCEIIIDYSKCIAPNCKFACVKADRLYGRNVLKIFNSKPALAVAPEKASKLCNECLACEIHCKWSGGEAIKINVPL